MAKPTPTPNKFNGPTVVGLEGGRNLASRRHRRERVRQRITSSVVIAILIGVVVAAGYVGYTVYDDQRAQDESERDRRVAELEAQRAGRTAQDIINELDANPRWNGPGAPAFGVGDDAATIEVTDGNLGG